MAEKTIDVTALGELLIDFTENGTSAQGNPILEVNPGGAPCNVLAMLQKLGKQTAFIGKVGDDMFGRQLTEAVSSVGVDTRALLVDKEVHTTLAFVHTYPDGDRDFSFYRNPGADMMLTKEDVDEDLIRSSRIFHFGTLSSTHKGVREATRYAIDVAKEAGDLISFDPNLRPALWKSQEVMIESLNFLAFQSDIVLPGIEEGKILTEFEEKEKIADFYLQHGVKEVIIKMGGEGAYYKTSEKEGVVEGFSVKEIVDTVGAGDGFAVGVISGRLEQLPIEEYVKRGNCIGALQIQVEGDNEGLPNREKLQNALNG